jgi:hypothetical protein
MPDAPPVMKAKPSPSSKPDAIIPGRAQRRDSQKHKDLDRRRKRSRDFKGRPAEIEPNGPNKVQKPVGERSWCWASARLSQEHLLRWQSWLQLVHVHWAGLIGSPHFEPRGEPRHRGLVRDRPALCRAEDARDLQQRRRRRACYTVRMAAPPSSLGLRFDASSSAAIKQEPPPPEISFDDLILRDQCGPDDMLDARAPTGFFRPTNSFYPPPSYYPSEFPSLSIATELSPSTDGSLNGSQMHSSISPDTSPHHQLLPAAEGDPPPRLLILGIPDEGTRTRVETQIRITLMLVQPLTHDNVRLTTPSGQLLPSIRDHAVKLAQWKYLKLPGYTAIKRKHKKYQKSGGFGAGIAVTRPTS